MSASIKRPAGLARERPQAARLGAGRRSPRSSRARSLLRLISGVGFANYDTLYALAWGGQLARGQTPAYGVPIAPTPHPLLELLGLVLAPLGPAATVHVDGRARLPRAVRLRWVIYRLGADGSVGPPGRSPRCLFLTRVPVLSYGVRAYVDLPYLLLVLSALLVESRHRRRTRSRRRARARPARARRPAASRGVGVLRALLALSDGLGAALRPRRADRGAPPAPRARRRSCA